MILHSPWPPRCPDRLAIAISALAAMLLVGCASTHQMMPTPTLYTGPRAKILYPKNHSDIQTPPLDLLFITDRTPATNGDPSEPYTFDRSRSMAFGSTTILFGENITWKDLLQQSTTSNRTTKLELKLGSTKELGHYPPIPYKLAKTSDGLTRSPAPLMSMRKLPAHSRQRSRVASNCMPARRSCCTSMASTIASAMPP